MRRGLAAALLLLGCQAAGESAPEAPPGAAGAAGWPTWGGDPGGSRYSPLPEITRENVSRLDVAWTYRTGDVLPGVGPRKRGKGTFEATPILLGDTLYFCSPRNRVFALAAETGEERWVFDPGVESVVWSRTCRGVAAHVDPARPPGAACRARILTATLDARLLALDARTGRPCPGFGRAGEVDLTAGIGDIQPGEYAVTSPPTVVNDVVVVGSLVGDNRRVEAPGGVIRGFDARSGALRWAFDPVAPGTPPASSDGSAFHRGTPNSWTVSSADPARDLVFVPTGSPTPDFYGGLRGFRDHYADSVVALRGATGEPVWYFRTVEHDLWDYDLAAQPTLAPVERDGRTVPALIQPTKMGHVFVLHRETGAPLYPVERRPAPPGDVPGEIYAPSQPVPTFPPPLHPHGLAPADAWGVTPWDRNACRLELASLRNQGIFTPPSLEGSVQYPGVAGGTNWGSAAFDPERQLLVLPINRMANTQRLVPRDRVDLEKPKRFRPYAGLSPQDGTPFAVQHDILVSPFGVPCAPPPWGTLVAVDFRAREVRWEVPLGSSRELAPFPFWLEIGLVSMGGPLLTAGGLVFIGAAMDDTLRAFDAETGETLWQGRLPAGGQATPMTYRLPGGRQYVVIAAGGHGAMGTTAGDFLVAYALPRRP